MSRPSLRRSPAAGVAPLVGLLSLTALAFTAGCETIATSTDLSEVRREPRVPPLQRHAPPETDFDVDHYAIDLRLYPDLRNIEARCRIRFYSRIEGLAAVELDLEGLDVSGVEDAAGAPLPYAHRDGRLTVELSEPLADRARGEVTVVYGGKPSKGLWFTAELDGRPTQVFTQGECEDSRWWFPCQDIPSDRATSEVRVTMPGDWTSVAAGELVESSQLRGRRIDHWRMDFPHPPYLLTLVAGRFAVLEDEWNGIPLTVLVEPRYAAWAEPVFDETDDMLSFFSELTGIDYPYPKYSQACVDNFPFGGMENISATTLTDLILTDERGLRDGDASGLIAHEAAHQWFGNLVTCRDWSEIWLNESFATYAEALWVAESEGEDAFRVAVRDIQDEYVSQDVGNDRRPIVWNVYRDPIDLFSKGGQTYPGGAARLHLLRGILGDEAFFYGLRAYVQDNAGSSVVTEDLQAAMEAESGLELGWFFEQWFRLAGYPEFEVRWSWDEVRREVELTVSQVQRSGNGTPSSFQTPVLVEVRTVRGPELHKLQIDGRREVFRIACGEEPMWVRFDKPGWIPKQLRSFKEPEEWMILAAQDDDPNGRRDALAALGEVTAKSVVPEKKRLYVAQIADRLRHDAIPAARVAAARALGVARGPEARANLVAAASSDAEAEVRVAALESLRAWAPDPDLARFASEQYQAAYSWKTMGAAASLFAAADPERAYEWTMRQLFTDSPHDVLQGHLFDTLASIEHDAVRDQLVRWARDETLSATARASAVRNLARVAPHSPSVAEELRGLLGTDRYRLRRAVLEALASFDDVDTKRALSAYYTESVFPREKRVIEGALGL